MSVWAAAGHLALLLLNDGAISATVLRQRSVGLCCTTVQDCERTVNADLEMPASLSCRVISVGARNSHYNLSESAFRRLLTADKMWTDLDPVIDIDILPAAVRMQP